MVKRFKIVSELEKQNIMSFLLTNHYPSNCFSKEKRSIKLKAKNFKVEKKLLFDSEKKSENDICETLKRNKLNGYY